jgi:hypothetical protein
LDAPGYYSKTVELESEGKRIEAMQVIQIGEVKLERLPEVPTYNEQKPLTPVVPAGGPR